MTENPGYARGAGGFLIISGGRIMNDQREEAKIEKYAEKKKSGPIIKIMDKADTEVLIEA